MDSGNDECKHNFEDTSTFIMAVALCNESDANN